MTYKISKGNRMQKRNLLCRLFRDSQQKHGDAFLDLRKRLCKNKWIISSSTRSQLSQYVHIMTTNETKWKSWLFHFRQNHRTDTSCMFHGKSLNITDYDVDREVYNEVRIKYQQSPFLIWSKISGSMWKFFACVIVLYTFIRSSGVWKWTSWFIQTQ